ncbi:MAG: hypothetical protein WD313_04060, partial [Acidimicrobiia bacterium]
MTSIKTPGITASGNWAEEDEQQVRERLELLLSQYDPESIPAEEFWGHQFDAGLAWINFPVGHGGLGMAPGLQRMVN